MWLAAAAVGAGWGAIYCLVQWVYFFVTLPVHLDVRIWYVAAEAGLRDGWSSIYDVATLRSLSASFPAGERHINSAATFINPPPLAWLFAPLTAFSEPVAYGLWSLVSLGALIFAWYIASPYTGLARTTQLLLAIALWPVLLAFFFGQPTILILGLVAGAWWLGVNDRPVAAGMALAFATALKPQLVVMIPLALLASERYRLVVAWAVACAALAVVSAISLGPHGLMSWWQALRYAEADPMHLVFTLAGKLGFGPLTYTLWAVQGMAVLVIARRSRLDLDTVFSVGILGSLAIAFHLHQADYSMLILAAWLVLRASPPLWHRLWLLVGIVTLQLLTFGQPIPQFIFDAAWLAILAVSSFSGSGVSAPATPREAA